MTETLNLTYRFRLRDKHAGELSRQARAVNFVWNFCNETQQHALKWGKKWPSGYDLQKLAAGSSKELGILATTIDKVCARYEQSRREQRKRSLRWRNKNSLGWVPAKDGEIRFDGNSFVFGGRRYSAWITRPMAVGQRFGLSSFSQDSLGRWYVNLLVKAELSPVTGMTAVGVDLGLKDLIVTSEGRRESAPQWFRRQQKRIATAQRANKRRQVKSLGAKVAAQRADHLHKLSTSLVREHGAIFVGNVSAEKLAKTTMAKSVYDASWSSFRRMLAYKSIANGVIYAEVNEAWSTQTCNACGVIAGPKGRAGLNKRMWICVCGTVHDRDVNAALNIRALGLKGLAEGAGASATGVANILSSEYRQ